VLPILSYLWIVPADFEEMKIEFFDFGKVQHSVILIYGNDPKSLKVLSDNVLALAREKLRRFAVHDLPGFLGVNGCELFFSVGPINRGVRLISPPKTFECSFRNTWWDDIEYLIEAFRQSKISDRFQHLDYGLYSDIQLKISADRKAISRPDRFFRDVHGE
jgi:hypothetical protein